MKQRRPATLETIARQIESLQRNIQALDRSMQTLADRIVPFDDPRPVVIRTRAWSPVPVQTTASIEALAEMIRDADAHVQAIEADFRAVRVSRRDHVRPGISIGRQGQPNRSHAAFRSRRGECGEGRRRSRRPRRGAIQRPFAALGLPHERRAPRRLDLQNDGREPSPQHGYAARLRSGCRPLSRPRRRRAPVRRAP